MTDKTKEGAPAVSLVIAVYKNIPYLEMVLLSIARQSFRGFEVIIAEDNNGEAMKAFIQQQQQTFSFPIKHVSQEKKGFRKNRILNEAVKTAKGQFIQFIDGDSVLHKDYLAQFYRHAKKGLVLYGRRVELDEATTEKLIAGKNLSLLKLKNLALTNSRHIKHALYIPWVLYFQKPKVGIWGCSMGMMKEDLLRVNGFDEDYVRIGVGEDIDLEWRLLATGIKLKSMKYRAFQYHLYHDRLDREEDIAFNFELLNQKKQEGKYFCLNGIEKRIAL